MHTPFSMSMACINSNKPFAPLIIVEPNEKDWIYSNRFNIGMPVVNCWNKRVPKLTNHLLPGKVDLSQIVSDANEVFGQDFVPPTSIPQQIVLRRNRNQFTAAEDNLILRGVVRVVYCLVVVGLFVVDVHMYSHFSLYVYARIYMEKSNGC